MIYDNQKCFTKPIGWKKLGHRDKIMKQAIKLLKAAVRKFCLFVAISVWKPGIQLCAELSSVRGVVFRHGSCADESNVLRSMCVSLSVIAPVWILHSGITDSSLRLGIYDPNKNCHRILSSEQVSNKSAMFVLTNWGKKTLQYIALPMVIKSKDRLTLDHITSNCANYYCYTLFSND